MQSHIDITNTNIYNKRVQDFQNLLRVNRAICLLGLQNPKRSSNVLANLKHYRNKPMNIALIYYILSSHVLRLCDTEILVSRPSICFKSQSAE